MANVFSLQNTLGAGQRHKSDLAGAAQNQEFNALRISGERQKQNLAERTFDADTQLANTEFLVGATDQILAAKDPVAAARLLLPEASKRGIVPEGIDVSDGLDLEEILQINQQAKIALGQSPERQKFGTARAGTDAEGNPIGVQTDQFGAERQSQFGLAAGSSPFGGEPSAVQLFNTLSEAAAETGLDGKPTKRAIQAQTQLGTRARAGTTSSRERIATDEELTGQVADSEATIAQRKKFGERTGASRAKMIDDGFESITQIDVNTRNLDKAIAAIDEGASTGAIESRFAPTVRASTIKLEQIQKLLGLDVIGSVTFGALSKGELDLALETALPTGLQPPELREWLEGKKSANAKLRDYFESQIDFLDQGGTIAGFLRQQKRGKVVKFDNQGNRID